MGVARTGTIKHNITAWYIHTNKNVSFTTENIIRYTEQNKTFIIFIILVSGGRDDPVNYDDEQFTEEGTYVFFVTRYLYIILQFLQSGCTRDVMAKMCID